MVSAKIPRELYHEFNELRRNLGEPTMNAAIERAIRLYIYRMKGDSDGIKEV